MSLSLYGRKSAATRRRFARRTAGSEGRSGGSDDEFQRPPGIYVQSNARGAIYDARVPITIRLFAGLRERAGTGKLELENVATVADVWPALDLGDEPGGLLYAVNRTYVERSQVLHDGDEVAVIPPVSGGDFLISALPLDIAAAIAEAEDDEAGAVASLVGTVRRHSRGRTVRYLEYEAFEEMAEPMLRSLADDLTAKHGLAKVAIHHRVGRVEIGEPSVVIAVSAPHRAGALDACREAIEALKERIPLWKKEFYEGGDEWIGRGS